MRLRVLMVLAEEPDLTIPLRDFFHTRGDQVSEVASIAEAHAEITRSVPDLIVLDVGLCGKRWFKTLQRHASAFSKFPLILASSNVAPSGAKEHKAIEKWSVITQPFDRSVLDRAVETALAARTYERGQDEFVSSLPKVKIPLRTKITLPYALLALMIALSGAYVVSRVVFDTMEERFTNQLVETGKISTEWMVDHESNLLESLRLVIATQGLGQAIEQGDRETLRELAYPLAVNSELETLEILDREGSSLLTMLHGLEGDVAEYDIWGGDGSLAELDFVRPILDGQSDSWGDKYSGIGETSCGTCFYIAGPVVDDDDQLIGVVLVGESLDNMVEGLREATMAQATIYDLHGVPIASTLHDLPPVLTQGLVIRILEDQDETSLLRGITSANLDYSEIVGPLEAREGSDIGLLGTSLPESFIVRLGMVTSLQVFIFVAVVFLLVILVGVGLANHITQPLMQVVLAAVKVARGDLRVKLEPASNDEIATLAHSFNHMVDSLRRSNQELLEAYDTTIEGWSRALELVDHDTEGHCQRVAEMTLELTSAMGATEEELPHIRRGAFLHDIGKMGIPGHILNKPGPLTDEEWIVMRRHPLYAEEMLSPIEYLSKALDIPLCHHEKWDGSGYPHGLGGEEIPLVARIFAVVDVWDALLSDRPYRKAWDRQKAIDHIVSESGTHFDPLVVEKFFDIIVVRNQAPQVEMEPLVVEA